MQKTLKYSQNEIETHTEKKRKIRYHWDLNPDFSLAERPFLQIKLLISMFERYLLFQ